MKKPPDMPKHIRGLSLVYDLSIANPNIMSRLLRLLKNIDFYFLLC